MQYFLGCRTVVSGLKHVNWYVGTRSYLSAVTPMLLALCTSGEDCKWLKRQIFNSYCDNWGSVQLSVVAWQFWSWQDDLQSTRNQFWLCSSWQIQVRCKKRHGLSSVRVKKWRVHKDIQTLTVATKEVDNFLLLLSSFNHRKMTTNVLASCFCSHPVDRFSWDIEAASILCREWFLAC